MMLLIDYVHELGAKIGLSEEETERIWFDVCGGDLKALTNALAMKETANYAIKEREARHEMDTY